MADPKDEAPPQAPVAPLGELERQVDRSQLFTHTALSRHSQKLNEMEAFLYGLVDVLVERGVVAPEDLTQAARKVREELVARREVTLPGLALRVDPPPESRPIPQPVNCAERLHVCQAACCRLDFALSRDEIEAGHIRWDLGRPYYIRHRQDGYCCHSDEGTRACQAYANRPDVCRRYSCQGDERIWKDFDKMELNHAWLDAHLGPDSPRLMEARMEQRAQVTEPDGGSQGP